MAWPYDPANRARAVEILSTNAQLEPAIADAAYEWVESGGYPADGLVGAENISRTIEVSQQFGALGDVGPDVAEAVVDISYVEAADDALPDDVRSVLEAVD